MISLSVMVVPSEGGARKSPGNGNGPLLALAGR
jgi:hypothetical protein